MGLKADAHFAITKAAKTGKTAETQAPAPKKAAVSHPNSVTTAKKPNDYQKMKKEEYSKDQYGGFKTKKPPKGTPGFIVEYKDVKNPENNGTIFRDRYSKEGVLLSKNKIDDFGFGPRHAEITAGSLKGEIRIYCTDGNLSQRITKDGSQEDVYSGGKVYYSSRKKDNKAYTYGPNQKIKSICDFNKGTETFYNGKTTPDSIISHKKDRWIGDGVRIK